MLGHDALWVTALLSKQQPPQPQAEEASHAWVYIALITEKSGQEASFYTSGTGSLGLCRCVLSSLRDLLQSTTVCTHLDVCPHI